ncbi:hypothetical protein BT63DRAFT_418376 [Microthyrium microscopicum]|uniref:Centrosomin N-terminal motif 1 domain-containing protein n=1 Tax=Microthyrium microscopicum TaxID=703497 RepID=A0A6A6TY38_9PEZI|nr:hypothetical protein BT63DRAFT_418376 [Microthyrium microscopicum]
MADNSPLPLPARDRSLAGAAPDANKHTAQRISSTNSNLPPLPDDTDFSQLSADPSALLDHDVKNRLMDIESSFAPDPSPSALPITRPGADDTYLFGGSPGRTESLANGPLSDHQENTDSGAEPDGANETSSLSDLPSSPAASAMKRRTAGASTRENKFPNPQITSEQPSEPSSSHNIEDENAGLDIVVENEEAEASMGHPRSSRRPQYLQNRHSSQRSSVSSIAARSDISGITESTIGADFPLHSSGADFAIQSGGAVPIPVSDKSGPSLSRLPSFGSEISQSLHSSYGGSQPDFSRTRSSTSNAGMGRLDTALGRLDEDEPATPRVSSNGISVPSDTVIARHVQGIQVPETIARQYREKHSTTRSPERRQLIGQSYSTRSKHNLTLKEQNSKIDKLSKENFDLKLKIHFLDEALHSRSDEGVKDMVQRNVQLQTDLANEKKDNSSMRRKIRDLERKLKSFEEKSAEKPHDSSEEETNEADEEKAEMEEEIVYLRETLETTQTDVERLKEDNMSKELEKRRLAEYIKSMGDRRPSEPSSAVEETNDMWKDLLQAETARREAADEDAEHLREEIRKMKAEHANVTNNHSTHNVYNIQKRLTTTHTTRSDGNSEVDDANGMISQASTLVDLLQQEKVGLRREVAELRRDLSAQTSMLTSRNKERERLQQEIEDLKIHHRRGGVDGMGARSIAGDSIFDRSVSRAHQRSSSRASGMTRVTQMSDPDRDELEKRFNTARDELAAVKMENQDLGTGLNKALDDLEEVEANMKQLMEENELLNTDLQGLQEERNELLESIELKDTEFQTLRDQAVLQIDQVEDELKEKNAEMNSLQEEHKTLSEQAVWLDDELNSSRRKEETLKQQLEEAEHEIEELEQKVSDLNTKNERLDVQLEGSQDEIAFLREEQEGDKIKIGELEGSLSAARTQIEDMLAQAAVERRQREALDSEEKAQIQTAMDELNGDVTSHKDDLRKLRKKLADKENEADNWKERLETLEANLREALGDLSGTRSSILKDVTKLQRDLEHTLSALDITRQDLSEKERTLRTRDALLESAGLETKKLSELLDKERQARRLDQATFNQMQRSQQSLTRTIQQNDTRVSDIEGARQADRRKFNTLETQLKEQLAERNNLLFSLWNRLTTICGRDWNSRNPLGSEDPPTSDYISKNWPTFSRHIASALKAVETLYSLYRTQIRDLDRKYTKDFSNFEKALDHRTKRIDALEKTMSRQTEERAATDRSASQASSRKEDAVVKLKSENKLLKAEVQILRNTSPARAPVPERASSTRDHRRDSSLMRHYSTSAVEGVQPRHTHSPVAADPSITVPGASQIPLSRTGSPSRRTSTHTSTHQSTATHTSTHQSSSHQQAPQPAQSPVIPSTHSRTSSINSASMQPSEQRWVHRLKELERRLKQEREARLLDRSGARKRIEETEAEKESLRVQLEREIEKRQSLEGERSSVDGLLRDVA